MSALMTTVTVGVLAERIVRWSHRTDSTLELDLEEVVAAKDRLLELARQHFRDWNLEILTVTQAAILRDLYWNNPEGA